MRMSGLEPMTPCMSSRYSNQLSYTLTTEPIITQDSGFVNPFLRFFLIFMQKAAPVQIKPGAAQLHLILRKPAAVHQRSAVASGILLGAQPIDGEGNKLGIGHAVPVADAEFQPDLSVGILPCLNDRVPD